MNSKRTDRISDPPIRTCWAIRWLRAARKSVVGKCLSVWQIGRQWFIDTMIASLSIADIAISTDRTSLKNEKYIKNIKKISKISEIIKFRPVLQISHRLYFGCVNRLIRSLLKFALQLASEGFNHVPLTLSASLWSWNGLNQAHSVTLFLYESLRESCKIRSPY